MFLKQKFVLGQHRLPLGDAWSCPTPRAAMDVEAIIRRTLDFAQSKFPITDKVSIEWRNFGVTAGQAILAANKIRLSRKLLVTEQRLADTLLHEYAHLVVFRKHGSSVAPHGREWKRVMRTLGQDTKATHSYECERVARTKRYLCKCEACGYELGRTRPLKRNRIYRHIGCGGSFRQVRTSR